MPNDNRATDWKSYALTGIRRNTIMTHDVRMANPDENRDKDKPLKPNTSVPKTTMPKTKGHRTPKTNQKTKAAKSSQTPSPKLIENLT